MLATADGRPRRRLYDSLPMRRLIALLAVLAFAGCGSSGTSSSSSHPNISTTKPTTQAAVASWTGLGAKLSEWETAHPKRTEGCPAGTCFGTKVPTGSNESAYEFMTLETTPEGRVDGYSQALGEGISVAAARQAVRKLLPSDTTTVEKWTDHEGGSCLIWNVRSPTLGRWFAATKVGDPEGNMSIELSTENSSGEAEYNPEKVTVANVGLGATHHGIRC